MTPAKAVEKKIGKSRITAKSTSKVAAKAVAAPAAPVAQLARYFQGVGGRKTATARVRIFPKQSGFLVNKKNYTEYFRELKDQTAAMAPLATTEMKNAIGVEAQVAGGGIHAQAEAVRHGLSRALVEWNEEFKKKLRRDGFMTRDARHVERKKYGLKKARRAPQWAKR